MLKFLGLIIVAKKYKRSFLYKWQYQKWYMYVRVHACLEKKIWWQSLGCNVEELDEVEGKDAS